MTLDLDQLESLLAKATPGAEQSLEDWRQSIIATDDILAALPALIARVRELELVSAEYIEHERRAAALAMRERCAKACDDLRTDDLIVSAWEAGRQAAIAECAAAIRALEP